MALEPRSDAQPHPVDTYVGARIRCRRLALSLSQDALARELGLTFQQLQKYERGANRVSASKLYDLAAALCVDITFFFEGLPDPKAARRERLVGQNAG